MIVAISSEHQHTIKNTLVQYCTECDRHKHSIKKHLVHIVKIYRVFSGMSVAPVLASDPIAERRGES
jgi:hypothetical protein